jgi:hypothetical protein
MKWSFVGNNGGPYDGANATSEDHFKSSRLSSFVREIVQNSIDARPLDSSGSPLNPDKPVVVKFEIREIEKSEFEGFQGIWKHIISSRDQAKKSKNKIWESRYNEIIKKFEHRERIRVLCVHDGNTTGLVGPVDGTPAGPLFSVTKGHGLSSKQNDSSGGSFGHGASAAFLFSGSRCVYYYSEVERETPKFRFMGKSLLQSHVCPYDKNVNTVGTGFYANEDPQKTPLVDNQIPDWAKRFRAQSNFGVGTSVYIANTTFRDDLYDETCISLIANFFNAFSENQLEAVVNNIKINKNNINKRYKEYKKKFEDDQRDEIDVDFIENCFKSIETIINPDEQGKITIDQFGEVEWYLRLGEDVKWKKVGISRSIGMLITREPMWLRHFQGMKDFDMFICVKGQKGNELLKQLENPKHDAFEFDRISDLNEAEQVRSKSIYKKFTNQIRLILNEYARAELNDESTIDELANLFGQLSDDQKLSGSTDRGKKIILSDNITAGKRKINLSLGKGKKLSSKGKIGTAGKKSNIKKPKMVSPGGEKDTGFVSPNPKGNNIKLPNLRLVGISKDGMSATIYFTIPKNIKDRPIILYKKGETDTDLLDINGSNTVSGKKNERIGVKLDFFEDVRNFVLEGAVNV